MRSEEVIATDTVTVDNLPCPRLELRWEPLTGDSEGHNWKCTYSLVIPLAEDDIRSSWVEGNPREQALEIHVTRVGASSDYSPVFNGEVSTPYRDGVHAQWDCKALGGHLPIVAVYGNVVTRLIHQQ
jgi:hypothetical protein